MTDTMVSPTLFIENIVPSIGYRRFDEPGSLGSRIVRDRSSANKAILLDNRRAVDFNEDGWTAWAIGRGHKAVICKHIPPHFHMDAIDKQGNPFYIDFDPRLELPKGNHLVLDAVENAIAVQIMSPWEELQTEIGLPFFLVSSPNLTPSKHNVLVELTFDGMDFLPDIKAFVAFHLYLHRFPQGFPAPKYATITVLKRLSRFLQLAHRMHPRPGQIFPIHVEHEQRIILGVLVLDKSESGLFSKNKRQYRARIHLSETMERLPANTILYRRIEWQENEEFHHTETPIARIISHMVV